MKKLSTWGNLEFRRLLKVLFVTLPLIWLFLFQPTIGLPPRPEIEPIELNIVKNSYSNLSVSQKTIFDDFMDDRFPYGSNAEDILVSDKGTREWVRIASGLLFRGFQGDIENASYILQKIINAQYTDPLKNTYGTYMQKIYSDSSNPDENWREFIGCELIIILEKHKEKISSELVASIERSLIIAAEGAYKRNVSPAYSNIGLMSAFLLEYVGFRMNIPAIRDAGVLKSWEIFVMYNQNCTFSEYNSPTYYGVDMLALAMWRDLGPTTEMKRMGAEMEQGLWKEISLCYHFGFKNMVTPYFRAYGIDMQKYHAILGMWIALAIDDLGVAPFPNTSPYTNFECSNIFPAVQLGHSVPDDAITNEFLGFSGPRYLKRTIPTDISEFGKKYEITAMLHHDWMMGGVSGKFKDSNQFVVGGIHWNTTNGNSLAWLVISGMDYLNVEVTQTSMTIFQTSRTQKIIFYVNCENITVEMVSGSKWCFPGLNLEIIGDPSRISAEIANIDEFKIKFAFSPTQNLIKITSDLESLVLNPGV